MCFNPAVSITTAITEWILAAILPWKYNRARVRYFMSTLLIFLGIYQFTEFMLCKTGNADLWMRFGFIAYTVLPAIGLHSSVYYLKKKFNAFWIYIIPAIYIIFAIVTPQFVLEAKCYAIFVYASNSIFSYTDPIKLFSFIVYVAYYFGFILLSSTMGIKAYLNEKDPHKQKMFLILPLAIFLMAFPTFVLIVVFPTLNIRFPSVLCHFGLLLALTAFVGARKEHEYIASKK